MATLTATAGTRRLGALTASEARLFLRDAGGSFFALAFPSLLLAGMWTPGPMMPETLATISAYTPLGAASQAITAAWFSDAFPALQVVVMLGYVVVLYPLAAKLFRWS